MMTGFPHYKTLSFTWNGLIGRASPPQHGPIDPPVTTECSERAAWTSPVYCVVFPAKQHSFIQSNKHHPHGHMHRHMEHQMESTSVLVRGVLIDFTVLHSQLIYHSIFSVYRDKPTSGNSIKLSNCNTISVPESYVPSRFFQKLITFQTIIWNLKM